MSLSKGRLNTSSMLLILILVVGFSLLGNGCATNNGATPEQVAHRKSAMEQAKTMSKKPLKVLRDADKDQLLALADGDKNEYEVMPCDEHQSSLKQGENIQFYYAEAFTGQDEAARQNPACYIRILKKIS